MWHAAHPQVRLRPYHRPGLPGRRRCSRVHQPVLHGVRPRRREAARSRGYALYVTTDAPEPGKLLERFRELAARQVDGALIVPGSRSVDASGLDLVGLPWVQPNTTSPLPGVDLYRGAFEATEHLIAHGHQRVGFVGGGAEEPRHRGWRDACATHGVVASPGLYAPFTREGGYRAGLELAAADDRPGAIFASSDLIALGVLRALHEQEGAGSGGDYGGSWRSSRQAATRASCAAVIPVRRAPGSLHRGRGVRRRG
ncbi:substrate-binding domain-containing protein [Nonomuraea sp. NPDC003707]